MKLFGNIVIAALLSFPALSFAQTPEGETSEKRATEKETTRTDALPEAPKEAEQKQVSVKEVPEAPKQEVKKAVEVTKKKVIKEVPERSDVGHVIEIDRNEFVIDLGSVDGLKSGDSVQFFEIQKKGFGDEEVTVLEPITRGRVLEVTKRHARVHLPMNVVVPVGSAVMKSKAPVDERRIHREHPSGTELEMTVRPFIPLGTFGIGAVMDLEASHRFEGLPLRLSLVLSPMAFALTDEGNPNFMTAYGQVSYDTKYFEIGLGAGGARINDFGISATQFLRIGTQDGLNLKATSYLIAVDKFEFHGLKLAGQVPTGAIFKNTWIVGRLGIQNEGSVGLGYGELGVRTLVKGRGTSGSVFLTPSLGIVGITEHTPGSDQQCEFTYQRSGCTFTKNYSGPSAGLTIEWRP